MRDEQGKPTGKSHYVRLFLSPTSYVGVFLDSAQDLIMRPPPKDEDLARRFKTTVKAALSVGLTSLHDAGFKPDSLAFFRRSVCIQFTTF